MCVEYPGFADYHRFGEAVIIKTSGTERTWTVESQRAAPHLPATLTSAEPSDAPGLMISQPAVLASPPRLAPLRRLSV